MYTPNTSITEIVGLLSQDHFNLILVAEKTNIDFEVLIEKANEVNLKIVGGVFPGLIHGHDHHDHGLIIQYLDINTKIAVSTDLEKANPRIELPIWSQDYRSAMILIDGLTTGIAGFLESVYEFYGNRLTYVGGGCGSLSLKQDPCLFSNEGVFFNAAILLILPNNMTVGVKHGWKRIAGPFIANKTSGSLLEEINWEPAFDMYSRELAMHYNLTLNKDVFFEIAKGFPFGILREGYEDVVRDPILTRDEKTLTCVGEISQNTSINILRGDPDELIKSAEEAAMMAFKYVTPKSVFIVDCISRALFLGDNFKKELEVVNNVLAIKMENLTLEGVLSLGEISSYGDGYIEFFNKTIVVSAIA